MKKLTKMLAMVVAASSMQFAHAAGAEKDFEPVSKGGENKSIEIVNGQLLVRCTEDAEIGGTKTPYVYVGTNTDHFAQSVFAQGGLTNLAQYVHAGKGKIYMTAQDQEKDPGVYTTTISAPNAALNGVLDKVTKVGENTTNNTAIDDTLVAVMKESQKTYLTKMFNGKLYRVNGENKDHLIQYNATTEEWDEGISLLSAPTNKEIVDFVIVEDSNGNPKSYILYDDGNGSKKSYAWNDPSETIRFKSVSSIDLADDQKTVILVNGGISFYDGTNARKIEAEKTTKLTETQVNDLRNNAQLAASDTIVSSAVAGKTLYYVTAKKIGWYREHE